MEYFIRKSHFSLIELSLLARAFEKSRLPLRNQSEPAPEALTQTMLAMKASEKTGHLWVAIAGENPVGFLWVQESGQNISWIEEGHDSTLILKKLKDSLPSPL